MVEIILKGSQQNCLGLCLTWAIHQTGVEARATCKTTRGPADPALYLTFPKIELMPPEKHSVGPWSHFFKGAKTCSWPTPMRILQSAPTRLGTTWEYMAHNAHTMHLGLLLLSLESLEALSKHLVSITKLLVRRSSNFSTSAVRKDRWSKTALLSLRAFWGIDGLPFLLGCRDNARRDLGRGQGARWRFLLHPLPKADLSDKRSYWENKNVMHFDLGLTVYFANTG